MYIEMYTYKIDFITSQCPFESTFMKYAIGDFRGKVG